MSSVQRSNLEKEKQSIIIKTKDHVLDSVKRQEIFVDWSSPEGPKFAGSIEENLKHPTPLTYSASNGALFWLNFAL